MHQILHRSIESPRLAPRLFLRCTGQGATQNKPLPHIDSCTTFVDFAHVCSSSPNAGTTHKLLHGLKAYRPSLAGLPAICFRQNMAKARPLRMRVSCPPEPVIEP